MSEQYMTMREIAARIGVSKMTVYNWIRAGKIPAYRFGDLTIRVKREDAEAFLEGSKYTLRPRKAVA